MSDEQKIWTFGEAYDKVRRDTGLEEDDPDEEFMSLAEFIDAMNEGIDEAETEIMLLQQDYFLSYDYMPLVEGTSEYPFPANIYANKIRGLIYNYNGTRYPVKRFQRQGKFDEIEEGLDSGNSQREYCWFPVNNAPGGRRMTLVPAARETSILSPLTPVTTHIKRWFLRNANRVPQVGDYVNPEQILPTAVDASANTIQTDPDVAYVTGDKVKLSVEGSSVVPAGLTADTVYYVIAGDDGSIQLATSADNARSATAIDLTDTGTGFFTMKIAAQETVIRATLIDIPEYASFVMEWAKAVAAYKEGDPRLPACVAKLEKLRESMQAALAEAEPDDDEVLAMDTSAYEEMS